jgi:hypothetical protein
VEWLEGGYFCFFKNLFYHKNNRRVF